MNPRALIATGALVVDTFREAFARRIFWGFLGASTLLLALLSMVTTIQVGPATNDPAMMVRQTQGLIATLFYFAGMALAVFASSGLVSAMFEPGRIGLLLSKPISRTHLLLGRYLGNLLVVAVNILYLVGGAWLLFGLKMGVWNMGFLLSSLCTLFVFAVLLAVIVLVELVWESSAIATTTAFGLLFVSPILAQRAAIERMLGSELSRTVLKVLYFTLPRTSEISTITQQLIMGQPVVAWGPMVTTGLFGAAVLAAGVWEFRRKSF